MEVGGEKSIYMLNLSKNLFWSETTALKRQQEVAVEQSFKAAFLFGLNAQNLSREGALLRTVDDKFKAQ